MNILNGFSSINDSPIWTFTNCSYDFLCLQFFVGGNWKCVSIFFLSQMLLFNLSVS